MKVILGQSVGFGNDGNKIDTSPETLHDFYVKGLESMTRNVSEN
jgi:hypothetical protein